MAGDKPKDTSGIRSMNLPREVRDSLKRAAKDRGISVSALVREIMTEFVDGKLVVPGTPGPQIVSTSMWIKPELWDKFTKKSDDAGLSSQWIFRSWLDREDVAA